jgi:hypothetical protein
MQHLNLLDRKVESMHRRRRNAMIVLLLCVAMWAALIAEYMGAQGRAGVTHHLSTFFVIDVVFFQVALFLTLVFRHIGGIFMFVVLMAFHAWMYDQTSQFPPKKAASQTALELLNNYLNK